MALKLVALLSLCLTLCQAASLPMNQIVASLPVDQLVAGLQSFLVAPEQPVLSPNSLLPDRQWDRELDLESLGLVLQLKYNDPSNPLHGGHAHVKFPGSRFIPNLPFDDVDLDIEFNGSDAVKGVFGMKVDYKFQQTSACLPDRPQEGSFLLYRKLEGGEWKTRMTIDNRQSGPFFDIGFVTDGKTKLYAVFQFEEHKWEVMATLVPGQSLAINIIHNGVAYTGVATVNITAKKLVLRASRGGKSYKLVFDLNPAGEWGLEVSGDVEGPVAAKLTMQPDFKMGQVILTYKGENYAFMQITGEADMGGPYPKMANYVIKYNIAQYGENDHNGKAKVMFDVRTSGTKFLVSVAPQNGASFEYVRNMDFSNGIKYSEEFRKDSVTVQKSVGDYKWTNNVNKFELETVETFQQTKDSPFFDFNTKYLMFGREGFNTEKTRTIFFNKVQKNKLFNQFKAEFKTTLDGKIWYNIFYDSTFPKLVSCVSWLPSHSTESWQFQGFQEDKNNGGVIIGGEIVHGDRLVHQAEAVFDVKENSAGKFEVDILEKTTLTSESPFYWCAGWLGYPKNIEERIQIFVDKTAKSLHVFPKMKVSWEQITDGQKFREVRYDTTKPMGRFSLFWTPNRFSEAYDWQQAWHILSTGAECKVELKRGAVTILKYSGEASIILGSKKLEVKTVETVEQTSASPLYRWGPAVWGRYWLSGQVERTLVYNWNHRNVFMGKAFVESKVRLDGLKHMYFKLDTTSTPYTLVVYSPVTGSLTPNLRNLFGKDELTVNVWLSANKELKIETNIDQAKEIKITSQGATTKFELNGLEYMSVNFNASAATAIATILLPSGGKVTASLAWPKMTAAASNIVVNMVVTPDRNVNVKLGFEHTGRQLKVSVDAIGADPTFGNFKFSRKGDFKKRGPGYSMKWTGQDQVSAGPMAAFTPMDTDLECTMSSLAREDLLVRKHITCHLWKTFGHLKMGFKLQDQFLIQQLESLALAVNGRWYLLI